jgi:predicted lipoprotein with Yx(FWY)xxD motif
MKLRSVLPVIAGLGVMAALAACGSYDAKDSAGVGGGAPAAAAADAKPAGAALKVAKVDGFGPFVVNDKGRTVYRFDKDGNNPPKATCLGGCAQTWQPLMESKGFEIQEGIDKSLIGTVDRPEGKQLTLNNWPLYYFKDDLSLGQTAGYGVGGTWFAIAADGSKAPQDGAAVGKPGKDAPQVLKVSKVDGFAPFVTNEKGRTVYRFDKDSNKPAKTTCLGVCAKTWEPVLANSGFNLQGVDKSLVGLIDRPEGKQMTLNNWPLYYYKDDLKLGQTAGQGKGGTWFAIAPDGSKAAQTGQTGSGSTY